MCAGTGSRCLISGDPRGALAPATVGRLAGVGLKLGSPQATPPWTAVDTVCGEGPVCLLRSHSLMPEYWPFSVVKVRGTQCSVVVNYYLSQLSSKLLRLTVAKQ